MRSPPSGAMKRKPAWLRCPSWCFPPTARRERGTPFWRMGQMASSPNRSILLRWSMPSMSRPSQPENAQQSGFARRLHGPAIAPHSLTGYCHGPVASNSYPRAKRDGRRRSVPVHAAPPPARDRMNGDTPVMHASPRGLKDGAPPRRIGSLAVRLARNEAEVAAAQEVRYRVFYDELGAGKGRLALDRRDADRFDPVCDHLLVLDDRLPGPDHRRIVGTSRLLRRVMAAAAGGLYSQDEFALPGLVARPPDQRFHELGRSCVLPDDRPQRTTEVLWQGMWASCNPHPIGVMSGC